MAEPGPVAGSFEDFKRAEEERNVPRRGASASSVAAPEEAFREYAGSRSISPTTATTLMAPFVGANTGIAETLGMPADVVSSALNLVLPENLQIRQPIGGSEFIMSGMGYLGADPRNVPPRSSLERYLQAAGRGAGSAATLMMAPVGAARAGAEAVLPRTMEIAKKVLGEYRSGAAPVTNILAGAGAEAGAEAAHRLAPETSEYAPIVPALAGLAGGMTTALGAQGIKRGVEALGNYFEPLFQRGREALAGRALFGAAEKPQDVQDALRTAQELVPGSAPTTGQLNRGIGTLERAFAGRYPEFAERYQQQNAARADALRSIQTSGSPSDLSSFIRREFAGVDSLAEEEVKSAVDQANRLLTQIGGENSPEQYGALVRSILEKEKTASRNQRSSLYAAIDPNQELNIVSAPIREDIGNFYGRLSPQEIAPSGEEANIFKNISVLPDVMKFADLTALDSRITEAMKGERAANGETRTLQRLTEMKNYVQNAIFNAAENQSNFERQAIEQGRLSPENSMEARLREIWNLEQPPPEQLTPNLSQDAIDRLQAAKEAHRQYATTFRMGPVGEVLRTTGFADQARLLDANVASQFFRPGVEGFERAQAFRSAAGDNPAALSVMQDYAASSLRRAAENPDGSIDPNKFARWMDRHQDALRAFPEVAQRFSDVGKASEAVAETMSNRVRVTSEYQKGLLGSNFLNLPADADVTKTVGGMFNQRDAVRRLTELSNSARQDPDAFAGLRKAAADFMVNQFITPSFGPEGGAMKAQQFVQFLNKNLPSLRTMFSNEEINGMIGIAADLQRSSRVVPSGERQFAPDTKTILSVISNQPERGLLRQIGRGVANIMPLGISGGLGFWTLGPVGAALFAGADATLMRARSSGLEKTADLMREALLNPSLAASLTKNIPLPGTAEERSFSQNLIRQFGRTGAAIPLEEVRREERQPQRFAGGRVGRASGGRLVRNDHSARAATLIRAAEAAKKAHNATTEGILEQPDEAVAKALSIANKAI